MLRFEEASRLDPHRLSLPIELEQCERRFAHHMNVLDRGDAPSHTWDVRPRPRHDAGERTRS